MDDYVSKPIRAQGLLEAIERTLGESVATREPSCRPVSREESVVDWPEARRAVQGDENLLKIVVKTFLDEWPQLWDAMAQAIARQDAPALRRAAHTFKGSASYVGAQAACERAYKIEKLAESGDLGAAEKAFASLGEEVTRLKPVLLDYVAGSGGQ